MSRTTLNTEGERSAHALIRAGHYDMAAPWSFDAEDGNKLLGRNGDDWEAYGRWHLGEDAGASEDTKEHWKYPYGKDGKVYRRAVAAIRARASQQGDDTVFEAAGRLMQAMDEEEHKKEGVMGLRGALASRFGHFAAARAASEKDDETPDDEEEAKRATRAEDEAEAERKAEEEREAEKRRGRRARRARKGRRAEDGREEDDAADDEEGDDDEEDMKKAASAGHSFALEAAFRCGARAQRARVAAILAAPEAAANPVLAMSLALETAMTASQALAVLKKTPAASRGSALAERMSASGAGALRIGPSAAEAPRGAAAIGASWDHALKDFAPSR